MITICALLLFAGASQAAPKCLKEAELQARLYSANENEVAADSIRVKSSFFHSESRGGLYFGVLLDTREKLNVGLRKKDCTRIEINYVTDGL